MDGPDAIWDTAGMIKFGLIKIILFSNMYYLFSNVLFSF